MLTSRHLYGCGPGDMRICDKSSPAVSPPVQRKKHTTTNKGRLAEVRVCLRAFLYSKASRITYLCRVASTHLLYPCRALAHGNVQCSIFRWRYARHIRHEAAVSLWFAFVQMSLYIFCVLPSLVETKLKRAHIY